MSCGREISSLESVYFSGSPFFADINLALLYPMNALYFILPPFQALTVGALLDILWDSWACIFCAEVCGVQQLHQYWEQWCLDFQAQWSLT